MGVLSSLKRSDLSGGIKMIPFQEFLQYLFLGSWYLFLFKFKITPLSTDSRTRSQENFDFSLWEDNRTHIPPLKNGIFVFPKFSLNGDQCLSHFWVGGNSTDCLRDLWSPI